MDIEKLLKSSLMTAKWKDQLNRMKAAKKAIDYYNYKQIEHTTEAIQTMFPKTAAEVVKFIRTYPVTEQIIDDISLLFKKPPKIKLPENTDSTIALFMDEIVDKPMLYSYLLMCNRYVNLLDKVGINVRWYDNGKRIEYDLITPDRCIVLQDPQSPQNITAVLYQVSNMQDTPYQPVPLNAWKMVTDESYTDVSIDPQTGTVKTGKTEPNPYGIIPISWFSNTIGTDGFWIDKGNPFVAINEDFNVMKSLQKQAEVFQMYSTLVTMGLPADQNLTLGVQARINIPPDAMGETKGDAKYITPSPLLQEVDNLLNGDIDNLAAYSGLSNDVFRKKTQTLPSGYALKLSKSDVIEQNETEKQLYTPAIKDLLKKAVIVYSYHSKTSTLTPVKTVSIEYQPISIEQNPLEVANLRTINKVLGIGSPLQWLMEDNPEMTIDEAKARLADIKSEMQTYDFAGDYPDSGSDNTNDKDQDNMQEAGSK